MSSSSSSSSPPLHCFVNSSLVPDIFKCFHDTVSTALLTSLTFTNLLLFLPLYILIIWMGVQRWRRHVTNSHSDVFTYSLVAMEMIGVAGIALEAVGLFLCSLGTVLVAYYCLCMSFPAQTYFHTLTCVERYLAVVHPITYRGLKQAKGIRIRNMSVACVWLQCVLMVVGAAASFPVFPTVMFFFWLIVALSVVLFCSMSVFFVLIRHGMGADQTKRRAFNTIVVITAVLLLRFAGLVVFLFAFTSNGGSEKNGCMTLLGGSWLCQPSGVVLPLLFLHRTGALTCSRVKASEK